MKKLLSIIMLLSLAGSLYTMEDQREKEEEEKEQSENSTIMTEVTWGFLKGLPSDVALSIVSYLTLKERLHVLAGLLFEIKRDKKEHLLSEREELIKSLLKADDKEEACEDWEYTDPQTMRKYYTRIPIALQLNSTFLTQDWECPMCFDDLGKPITSSTTFACGHKSCESCIKSFVRGYFGCHQNHRHAKCPICRAILAVYKPEKGQTPN